MNNIKVSSCWHCPFKYSDYDDYSVGYDTADICILALFNNSADNTILVYDMSNDIDEPELPEWCPLRKESVKIELEKKKNG